MTNTRYEMRQEVLRLFKKDGPEKPMYAIAWALLEIADQIEEHACILQTIGWKLGQAQNTEWKIERVENE